MFRFKPLCVKNPKPNSFSKEVFFSSSFAVFSARSVAFDLSVFRSHVGPKRLKFSWCENTTTLASTSLHLILQLLEFCVFRQNPLYSAVVIIGLQ